MSSNDHTKRDLPIENAGDSGPANKAETDEPAEGIIVDQISISDGDVEHAESLGADLSKTRSGMRPSGKAAKNPNFNKGQKARLPQKGGPPMIVTVVDNQQNPGTNVWEYQVKDSAGAPVSTRPGISWEWITETRLRNM